MEVEDCLPGAAADVDDDVVVLEPFVSRRFGNELEHVLRLVGRKVRNVSECLNVALGDHEQVDVRFRVDVANRDDAGAGADVIALLEQATEEAIVRQRGFPPR